MSGSNCNFSQKVIPQGPFGQTKANPSPMPQSPGILQEGGDWERVPAPPESEGGGKKRGKPEALSQPVDPGGVGGYETKAQK